jgi:Zn finger protein HypA/HybF involved in hydrogenase expression
MKKTKKSTKKSKKTKKVKKTKNTTKIKKTKISKKPKKIKKCGKCGDVVKSYSYGDYCSVCAADVWDNGFESTTDHADQLEKDEILWKSRISKKLQATDLNYDEVRGLITYTSGDFLCLKCKKLRLTWNHYGKPKIDAELQKLIASPCPNCKTMGFLIFD